MQVSNGFSPEREARICTKCPGLVAFGVPPRQTAPSARRTACYCFEFQTSSVMMADAIPSLLGRIPAKWNVAACLL
jgi:hypothetical protein